MTIAAARAWLNRLALKTALAGFALVILGAITQTQTVGTFGTLGIAMGLMCFGAGFLIKRFE